MIFLYWTFFFHFITLLNKISQIIIINFLSNNIKEISYIDNEKEKMKKMLLMGYSGAGKTSMHSVIFANFPAKDTGKIGYTVERQ